MAFWEIGVGLWSTDHFVYNSGGSTDLKLGSPGPPLILRLNRGCAQRAEKCFLETALPPPPPYLRVRMTWCSSPLPLSEGLDLPLYNIATTHLCLQSLCFPCGHCRGKILRYFEPQNLQLALCFFSG